jgi:3-phenylpropionate/trans-cinnamate dioxygenase ferredoxin reductase subunit
VSAVVADDGTRHETELVVVGVGAVPADSLATEAGLATDNGVLVDEQLSTSAPHVSAIGDCARFSTRFADGAPSVRLESVQNATDQARYVAARLVAGAPGPGYDAVPWFWTEQFGRKLQIAGLTHGFDRVERTATDQDRFSIYCYRGETLLGCESVNSPREHLRARRRLAETTRAAAEA